MLDMELELSPNVMVMQDAAGKPLRLIIGSDGGTDTLFTKDQCAELAAVLVMVGMGGDERSLNEACSKLSQRIAKASKAARL